MGLPAEFRDALALMSVSDVETIYANLSKAMSLIEQLQLVNDFFPSGRPTRDGSHADTCKRSTEQTGARGHRGPRRGRGWALARRWKPWRSTTTSRTRT